MNKSNINKGFSSIYPEYDADSRQSEMSIWRRNRVYCHLDRHLEKESCILELNAGSGIDAVYLAKKGHKVLATDITDGFLASLSNKVKENKLQENLSFQKLSFEDLGDLEGRKFDAIYSNFGGLNCSNNLDHIVLSLISLLNDKGVVTFVVMPRKAPWEWLWIFKGKKAAFRRFRKKAISANVNGYNIDTWYHNYSKLKKISKSDFEVLEVENLGVFVPPNDSFSKRYPRLFRWLAKSDHFMNKITPRGVGDYYILTLRKK